MPSGSTGSPRPSRRSWPGREVADWEILIDRERCIGSGVCVVVAPATFTHDEHAKAIVLHSASDPFEAVQTAVTDCPTEALRLVIEGSKRTEQGA
jgi:ferredoxin